MIYYKILIFLFFAGFHVIFCRPELKFDASGNVLDANEFKTEDKPMDFLKLVASKVREAKKDDENEKPIEKDSKSKEKESKEDSKSDDDKKKEKPDKKSKNDKSNTIEFASVPSNGDSDIVDENEKNVEKNKTEKNDQVNVLFAENLQKYIKFKLYIFRF